MDKDFFYKVQVKEHKLIKEWFLDEYQEYIDNLPLEPSRTDYYLGKDGKKPPYSEMWLNYVRPYLKEFCTQFGVLDYQYHFWTAQYDTDIDHSWHIHPKAHFASVYYLELPYGQNSTEFWKKNFPAEEGDMVFFPAWWIHRSTPNHYDQRKTIIAGNITFNDYAFLP